MTPNVPPPNDDDPELGSLFEDFINRNLDLDGLDDEEREDEESGAMLRTDGEGRVYLEFQLPGGRPILKGTPGSPAAGPMAGPNFPMFLMSNDVRWQSVDMVTRPPRLRIYRPRIDFSTHAGQLVLTLLPRAPRHLRIIPEIRPGWTAVRYRTGRRTPAELIEWQGNKANLHRLQLTGNEITGLVRAEDMPATRPARQWPNLFRIFDVSTVLLLIIIVLCLALAFERAEGPTATELQDRIATLQSQITALEAQLETGPVP